MLNYNSTKLKITGNRAIQNLDEPSHAKIIAFSKFCWSTGSNQKLSMGTIFFKYKFTTFFHYVYLGSKHLIIILLDECQ